jgi:hypothetical protein
MTVIISLPHPQMIVMSADSRKTLFLTQLDNNDQPIGKSIEFESMTKIFRVDGVGCVTLWGDNVTRVENGFPRYLHKNRTRIQTVEDLRTVIDQYLRDELQPDQEHGDVGFHVAGFMPDGTPKLYHVFWGLNRPPQDDEIPDYHSYDSNEFLALYNGRNDFVDPIVKLLVELQTQVGVLIFAEDPIQRMVLLDFIARYISNLTSDVGGEIHTILIMPGNRMVMVTNLHGSIIPRKLLASELRERYPELGIQDTE